MIDFICNCLRCQNIFIFFSFCLAAWYQNRQLGRSSSESGSEPLSQFATQERGADVATPLGLMWRPPLELEKLSLLDWQIAGAWVRAKSWSFEIFARASDWVPAMIATAGYCCTYERCSRQSPYFPPLLVGAPCLSLLPGSQLIGTPAIHETSTRYFLHDAHSPWEWRTTNKQPREQYLLRNGTISKILT